MNRSAFYFVALCLSTGLMTDPTQVSAQEEDDLILSNPMTEGMTPLALVPNYRDRMRETIEELSVYARSRDPSFILTALILLSAYRCGVLSEKILTMLKT